MIVQPRSVVAVAAVTVTSLLLTGCATSSPDPMVGVSQTVLDRTGHRLAWDEYSKEDAAVRKSIDDLLSRELTPESAVQVALLNNRSLRATFEDIGVARADLVRAGLLRNPIFEAKIKFADAGGGTALEFNAVTDFLEVFLVPLRTKVAAAELAAAQHRVTADCLALAADVRKAVYEAQAAQQAVDAWKTVLAATDASATFARRLHAAGNISDLDLAMELASDGQARLDAARADVAVADARERLTTLLGVWGPRAAWRIAGRLSDPPADDLPAAGLETLAVTNRPDLAAAKSAVEAAATAAGVARPLLWVDGAGGELGATAERGGDGGWEVGPVVAVPIPIFDTGAAALARRFAELRQAADRHAALAVEVRSQVRLAWAKASAARQRATFYRDRLLPLRAEVLRQTQLQYNAMHSGPALLLSAKQEQVRAGMEYVEALKEYWVSRAELERAVGGKLPANAPATRPASGSLSPSVRRGGEG